MFNKLSKPVKWILSLLIVIIISSICASLVQNSFFQVKVQKVKFDTERGTLSGYLYVPRYVDKDNPAPAVVLTHGYLNNKEMQEIGAIELSRRGFVVLAFDQYDHGDSRWDTPAAFNFYVYSVYDAVQYIYNLDYVLKDAKGNGMIGVSGHSMGGFSSVYAVIWDEQDFASNGYRKIAAALPVGADLRYIIGIDKPETFFGPRSVGFIAAHWDQFFFDNTGQAGSVKYKDFVKDPVGKRILGLGENEEGKASEWYLVNNGQRIIYTPDETHPQNHFSLESGRNTIEFFTVAFNYQLGKHGLGRLEDYGITEMSGQVWWLKEAFTLIALVALFMMIIPGFMLITQLPFFKKVYKTEQPEEVTPVKLEPAQRGIKAILITLTMLLSAFYLNIWMDRQATGLAPLAKAMNYLAGATIIFIAIIWIISLIKNEERLSNIAHKVTLHGAAIILIALAYRWVLTHTSIIQNNNFWSAPSINTIGYWAMAAGFFTILVTLGTTPLFKAEDDNVYGLKASWMQVLASFVTAVALVFGLFLIVGLVELIFKTDFRFYVYAIKIFNTKQFVTSFKYMPVFFVYYFAVVLAVFVNTRKMKDIWGDILASVLLVGPVILFLIYQYGVLYRTGVAPFPNFSLNAILCVGLIPTLVVAGIILRRFAKKTGNIWTGVFFTTMFFTFITLANTAIYELSFR